MLKVVLCGRRNTRVVFTRWVAGLETLHSTLDTPQLHTLYTSHSTLYIPHFTLYTLHSTLYTPHSTLRALHSRLHTPHFTLHTLHFTLHTLHFTLHTLHLHFTLHTLHSRLYTPDSTLHTPRLARHPLPYSTVYGAMVWSQGKNVQDCSNKLFHKSVLRDCISMCFDICTINIYTCEHSG